VAPDSSGALT